RGGWDLWKTPFAQDCCLQCELGGKPGADLLVGWRLAGLVVENGEGAVRAPFDPVGACRQDKFGSAEWNRMFSGGLGKDPAHVRTALAFPASNPVGDADKTRPPEGASLFIVFQWREVLFAKRFEFARDIGRQCVGVGLGELTDRFVDESSSIRGAGRRVDDVERDKPQHMFGVD